MIFIDTSALYALADRGDPNHEIARRRFQAVLDAGEKFLTHNYVVVEAIALTQHRLGSPVAAKLARDATAFAVEWVDKSLHEAAEHEWSARPRRQVSFVDEVSFEVMRRRSVTTALAFDPDFTVAGFELYGR